MAVDNILQQLFIYVPNNLVDEFISDHTGGNVTSNDDFYKKFSLLGGTGKIAAHGEIFGLNSDELYDLLGNSLSETDAESLNASTVIDFIQAVYDVVQDNTSDISTNATDIRALETRVGLSDTSGLSKRIKDNEDAITLLNKTDGTTGSIKKTVDDAIAAIVADAPASFDTLKEIADWISNDVTGAAKMASDISDLQAAIGANGSVSQQITAAINDLDVTASTQSAAGTASNNGIFVVSGVTLGETDGKISGFAVTSQEVEQAGAAAAAKTELIGNTNDAVTTYTIHGAFNYAHKLVEDKNVTATSTDTSYITVSYSGNSITISPSNELKSAVDKANTAIQSIQYTSTNNTYISVGGATDPVTVGAVTMTVTPNMGSLYISNKSFAYSNGLAYTENIADVLNSIELWGEYTSNNS